MKTLILIPAFLLQFSLFIHGQEFLSVSEAFTRSYSYEKGSKYADAANEP